MRALIAALCCAVLGACSDPSNAEETAAPSVLVGDYRAITDAARTAPGDVTIEHGGLVFSRGAILYTRRLQPRAPSERIARDGLSYAAVVRGADLNIELRRVTEETLANGAASLCGAETPAYVALAHDERSAHVTVLVFTGDEPPGPQATSSRLCGSFAYTLRESGRHGVVL
ncbi:MAG: hypothetical protein DCF16_07835 [Alphaproteobacteria bacterium]|nr:MAG: hypothetical protein DCF16_07835 [Alphaproteobacteria bacterium]